MAQDSDIASDIHTIPEFEIDALARCLLPAMRAYFDSEEGQRAFAEWKAQQEHTAK